MGTETERELEFHCPLGEGKLMVRHFAGNEHLGGSFEYVVTLFSADANIELDSLLGKPVTVELKIDPTQPRYFNGIVAEFGHYGFDEQSHALYRLVMRPWFWLLSRNRDCRIFQNKTALEIARKIFEDHGFSDHDDHLFVGLTPREYCVQWNESDFDFISRLFEYEGIYYFYKHEKEKHTLVLADSSSAHDPTPGFETIPYLHQKRKTSEGVGQFSEWHTSKQVLAGKLKLNDYNFKKSRADISAVKSDPKPHEHADSELYLFPGFYYEPAPGTDNATVRLEEAQMPYELAFGTTDCRGVSTGALFTLEEHGRKDQNRQYLVVATSYTIDSGQYRSGGASALRMRTHVTALDGKIQYRPARTTPVPRAPGPQTARIVGPKDQEIWTDNFGRVKVQFAWDHEGKNDENSSCFIRVSQTWAGKDWGSWHVPRIGQEVLVDFLDGDVDRPVVVGRVHNDYNVGAWNMPAHATRSGWKTHSLEGGKDDYNELRFEDAKKKEEIFIRAQRNMTTRVRNNRATFIGNNHTHTVSKNMKTVVQKGDFNATVSEGTMLHYVPKNVYDVCAKEIVQTADDAITFRVGEVSICIDTKGITLSAGSKTEIKMEFATMKIVSAMVDINPIGEVPEGPAKVPERPTPEKKLEKFEEVDAGAHGAGGGGGGGAGGAGGGQ